MTRRLTQILLVTLLAWPAVAAAQMEGPMPPQPEPEQPPPPPPDGAGAPLPPDDYGSPQPRQPPQPDEYLQPPPPPEPPKPPRRKLLLGGALGLGSLAIDGCGGCDDVDGVSLMGDIGWFLRPSLALMGDFWLNAGDDSGVATSVTELGLGVRWFPNERVHVQGMLTLTQLNRDEGGSVIVRGGPGISFGVGVELKRWKKWALELRARVGFGDVGEPPDTVQVRQTGVLLGLSWG